MDSSTSPEAYREILTYIKKFLNYKKIPSIASLVCNNKFITNLRYKAELFTNFFLL